MDHEKTFSYLSEMYQIVQQFCNNAHLRIHTRTFRNTTLHHPSMHSDNDPDPQTHLVTRPLRTHLGQSRISGCAPLIPCWSTREWVVAALGRRWTWRLWRATCRRASRLVQSIANGRGWPSSSVRQRVAALKARRSSSTSCRWC